MSKCSYNFFCAFLNEKNLNFVFPMSLCGCVCAAQTDTDSRKINLPFSLACPRVLQRHIAAVRESWSSTLPHFFRLYEKSTKKVHEGLASPLDSRGRRKASAPLRSAGFTAILEFSRYVETQNAQFVFTF